MDFGGCEAGLGVTRMDLGRHRECFGEKSYGLGIGVTWTSDAGALTREGEGTSFGEIRVDCEWSSPAVFSSRGEGDPLVELRKRQCGFDLRKLKDGVQAEVTFDLESAMGLARRIQTTMSRVTWYFAAQRGHWMLMNSASPKSSSSRSFQPPRMGRMRSMVQPQ